MEMNSLNRFFLVGWKLWSLFRKQTLRIQEKTPGSLLIYLSVSLDSPLALLQLSFETEILKRKKKGHAQPCSVWLCKPIPFLLCIQDTHAPPPVVFADVLCTPAAAIFKSVIQYTDHTMCHYTPTSKVCLSVGTEDLSICHSPPVAHN